MPRGRHRRGSLVALVLGAALAACTTVPAGPGADPTVDDAGGPPEAYTPLLTVETLRDGDSFVASDGVEYRIGMINTPELSECGGREAADRTAELLADGFVVEPYSSDTHDRQVARVRAGGEDVGVTLAEEGLADDRYLQEFRAEHPAYAAELDAAFADARREEAGLWQTCWSPSAVDEPSEAASVPSDGSGIGGTTVHVGRTGSWSCHAAYVECLPDGPDLDCRDVGHQVALVGQGDPYRLDGNTTTATDGVGCDTFPAWDDAAAYPYYAS